MTSAPCKSLWYSTSSLYVFVTLVKNILNSDSPHMPITSKFYNPLTAIIFNTWDLFWTFLANSWILNSSLSSCESTLSNLVNSSRESIVDWCIRFFDIYSSTSSMKLILDSIKFYWLSFAELALAILIIFKSSMLYRSLSISENWVIHYTLTLLRRSFVYSFLTTNYSFCSSVDIIDYAFNNSFCLILIFWLCSFYQLEVLNIVLWLICLIA